MNLIIIFPNTLFANNRVLDDYIESADVAIIEHPVYFTLYRYHKLKLILHRASMKNYHNEITIKYQHLKPSIKYIDCNKYDSFIKTAVKKYKQFIYYDQIDNLVNKEFSKYNIDTLVYPTKLFIADLDTIESYDNDNQTKYKSYVHANFYKWMRKQYNVLIVKGKPIGDKWSFDQSNRNPFGSKIKSTDKLMYHIKPVDNQYITEARNYVTKYFNKNPGSTSFYLPIDTAGAINHFNLFLKNRLQLFGTYQDAVNSDIDVGYHSLLSPMLNIGLITPSYVVRKTQEYGLKHKISIANIEGFIRQILGWREIMRMIYVFHPNIHKENYFNHSRKLNKDIWYKINKSTGFDVIDDLIKKVDDIAYLHHIERLMYIGNYFLLNRIKPTDCYEWFMVFCIDSYNWVMTGNVYAMSQYSTGKLLMTRPYFSSSSYIAKMSNYKKNTYDLSLKINNKITNYSWDHIWDSLYYEFINDNYAILRHNYATSRQVANYDKKSAQEKKLYGQIVDAYFANY